MRTTNRPHSTSRTRLRTRLRSTASAIRRRTGGSRTGLFAGALLACIVSGSGPAAQATPRLSEIASDDLRAVTRATAISADGTTVVGEHHSSSGNAAFRWTLGEGFALLDDFGNLGGSGGAEARATGVSGDGSVVVGSIGEHAFRWEQGVGARALAPLASSTRGAGATAISDDGRYIVGTAHRGDFIDGDPGAPFFVPVLWLTSDAPIVVMNFLGTATDVSNTAVIVGSLTDERPFGDTTGFRVDLVRAQPQFLPGFGISEQEALAHNAVALTADGRTIVGTAQTTSPGATQPSEVGYVWSGETGLINILDDTGLEAIHVPLEMRPGDATVDLVVRDISSDGSTIVGSILRPDAISGETEETAFVWTRARGLESLEVVLASLGLDLTGWDLQDAISVSADGRTIVGTGRIATGSALERPTSFYAVLPEPSTGLLLAIGLGLLARAERRDPSHAPGRVRALSLR